MSVVCDVLIDGSRAPGRYMFSVLPREGEVIFISEDGKATKFRVVRVCHFTINSSIDEPAASVSLEVTRKDVVSNA